jgi:hypothetical protein
VLLVFVVLLLVAFLVVRPMVFVASAPHEGVGKVALVGVVESQGHLPNKWAPGGSLQWLKVRLPDGRVVDAVTGRSPLLRDGDRVTLRIAAGGPFPYEAAPADASAPR